MSVHQAISDHSSKQHSIVKEFFQFENMRESYIEEAVNLCMQGKDFSTVAINEVTKKMNLLAKKGIVPQRKLVTEEMVKEYVKKLEASK